MFFFLFQQTDLNILLLAHPDPDGKLTNIIKILNENMTIGSVILRDSQINLLVDIFVRDLVKQTSK
jgi:hypothetical protein